MDAKLYEVRHLSGHLLPAVPNLHPFAQQQTKVGPSRLHHLLYGTSLEVFDYA